MLDYVEDRLSGQGPSLLPDGATQRALARIIIGRYDWARTNALTGQPCVNVRPKSEGPPINGEEDEPI